MNLNINRSLSVLIQISLLFFFQTEDANASCGGKLEAASGTISSPRFPDIYPSNLNCVWIIKVSEGKRVHLSFKNFSLEGMLSGRCQYDYVEILDSSPQLNRFCASNIPPDVVSIRDNLTVIFMTDGSVQHTGFYAKYKEIDANFNCSNGSYGLNCSIPCHCQRCHPIAGVCEGSCDQGWTKNTAGICNIKVCTNGNSGPECDVPCNCRVPCYTHSTVCPGPCASGWRTSSGGNCNETVSCRHILTASTGSISTPNFPSTYPSEAYCEYQMTVRPGHAVHLSFDSFSVEGYDVICRDDYIQIIYDNIFLKRVCGRKLPPDVVSNNNNLTLIFVSDAYREYDGFHATYKEVEIPSCENGTFGVNCSTQCRCTSQCNLISGLCPGSCEQGWTKDSVGVCRFKVCSNGHYGPDCKIPCNCRSQCSSITGQCAGPCAFGWKQGTHGVCNVTVTCKHTYTNSRGSISSPDFPEFYPSDSYCEYRIIVSKDMRVHLSFTNFTLESVSSCRYDYVQLLDSDTDYGRYCGIARPFDVVSTNNTLTVIFKSDGGLEFHGFLANYREVDPSKACDNGTYGQNCSMECHCTTQCNPISGVCPQYCESKWLRDLKGVCNIAVCENGTYGQDCSKPCNCQYPCHVVTGYCSGPCKSGWRKNRNNVCNGPVDCGGIITDSQGNISSPSFPNKYPNKVFCRWHIIVSQGKLIYFKFTNFSVEAGSTCGHDFVRINTSLSQHTRLCGFTMPDSIVSKDHTLTISFTTDSYLQYTGFYAVYKEIDIPVDCTNGRYGSNCSVACNCGSQCHSYTGACTGPCDSGWIKDASVCNIKLCANNTYGPDCNLPCNCQTPCRTTPGSCKDPLSCYCKSRCRYAAGYCSGKCQSGWSKNQQGVCNKKAPCGGTLTASSGTITSPGYPARYPSDVHCDWRIVVRQGYKVNLTFTGFNVEYDASCEYDYVQLINSSLTTNSLCGTRPEFSVISLNNTLGVVFTSDSSEEYPGFIAHFQEIEVFVECTNGNYGVKCLTPCHCQSQCHFKTGVCMDRCLAGKMKNSEHVCNVTCSNNLYGPDCSMACNCETQCDVVTGECRTPCTAGYMKNSDSVCNTTCNNDHYGMDCATPCRCQNQCNGRTGHCLDQCIPGIMKTNGICNQECVNGNYGPDCRLPCHCQSQCDAVNGTCPVSCFAGKMKNSNGVCNTTCNGRFGVDCRMACDCQSQCDVMSGTCSGPCIAGRMKDSHGICRVACNDKTYGPDCNNACNCMTSCDAASGVCSASCVAGKMKNSAGQCDVTCSNGGYGLDCQTPCHCTSQCNPVTGVCVNLCEDAWKKDETYICSVEVNYIVSGVEISNITSDSAIVRWNAMPTFLRNTSYVFEYTMQDTGVWELQNHTMHSLSGLYERRLQSLRYNTWYLVRVTPYIDDGVKLAKKKATTTTFKTLCDDPAVPVISNYTFTIADNKRSVDLHITFSVLVSGHHCNSYEKVFLSYSQQEGDRHTIEISTPTESAFTVRGLLLNTGYNVHLTVTNNEQRTANSKDMFVIMKSPEAAELPTSDEQNIIAISVGLVVVVILVVIVAVVIVRCRRSKKKSRENNNGVVYSTGNLGEGSASATPMSGVPDMAGAMVNPLYSAGAAAPPPYQSFDNSAAAGTKFTVKTFEQYYRNLTTTTKGLEASGLDEQFQRLLAIIKSRPFTVCRSAHENRRKNRSRHLLPGEEGRVVIRSTPQNDYINAVYAAQCIVTQAPLKETMTDFWTMIYEQNCRTIVMLFSSDPREQYWPNEKQASLMCGPIEIRCLSTSNVNFDVVVRELRITHTSAKSSVRDVCQIQLLSWPENKLLPSNIGSFLQVIKMAEERQNGVNCGPIVVHDREGGSRCGLFSLTVYTRSQMKTADRIDVFTAALDVCQNRPQLIQKVEEYGLCHELLLRSIESGDHGGEKLYAEINL